MEYLIFVMDEQDASTLHAAPVPEEDAAYLEKIKPHLQPLSDEQYMTGHVAILQTGARYSYVRDGDAIFWCVEWDPGLLVVRFSSEGTMQWSAIRSPVPEFGGRTPMPEDEAEYDESAENPHYHLVFHPWDAQFDEEEREWLGFEVADEGTQDCFARAVSYANHLNELAARRFESESADLLIKQFQQNLADWAGEGIRIK